MKHYFMNTCNLPEIFLQRLREIIPPEEFEYRYQLFSQRRALSLRVNTLKSNADEVGQILCENGFRFEPVSWYKHVLILQDTLPKDLDTTQILQKGLAYIQSLSSMLPVLALNPQPSENVLDMCAAPGSKTTQIASHMNNQGSIVALDAVRDRCYKLRSVISLLGVSIADVKFLDARKFKTNMLFDKILVDASCSAEGRFSTLEPKTLAYWSPRKIKEMVHKQRGILLAASRLLKSGGSLVYSTCTFSPEENEGVIDWFLRKTKENFKVEEIQMDFVPRYPSLLSWGQKDFRKEVKNCLRVLPTKDMEGFFITKLVKE
ncbi:MAG: RsmB/NOP family class I SAM-dependent RNA methyltransferase [Candidatus Omnitrophota bacterium]